MVAFEERDCKSKVDETPLARVEKVQRCSGLCPPQRSLVDGLAGWSMGWLVDGLMGWLVGFECHPRMKSCWTPRENHSFWPTVVVVVRDWSGCCCWQG